MTKKNLFILTVATFAIMAFGSTSVKADDCVTQYGGSQYGTPCNPNDLVINKEVQLIGAKDSNGGPVYVENLSTSDASASAGLFMTFRLTVKNNSNHDFGDIEVKDIFPPFMSYPIASNEGPLSHISGGDVKSASYDPASRTLTMRLENVKAGESRQMIVTGKVDDSVNFPAGQSAFCVVNTAQVRGDGRFEEDTAQVCISNQNKGKSTLPKAGVDSYLMMLPFLALGAVGLKLTRKQAK